MVGLVHGLVSCFRLCYGTKQAKFFKIQSKMTENIITIIFIEYVGGSDIFFWAGGGGMTNIRYIRKA